MTKYDKESVEKAIKKDPRIKPKEAKLIHALLKGHSADAKEEFECVDCGEYPLVFEGDNEYEPDPITGEKRCFKCHIKESR